MIELHHSAFATIGQINRAANTGYSNTSAGLIYQAEYHAAKGRKGNATCDGNGEKYTLEGPGRNYVIFSGSYWNPNLEFHLDLTPNEYR